MGLVAGAIGTSTLGFSRGTSLRFGGIIGTAGQLSLLWIWFAGAAPHEAESLWVVPLGVGGLFGITAMLGALPVLRQGFIVYLATVCGFLVCGFIGGALAGSTVFLGLPVLVPLGLVATFAGGTTWTAWVLNHRAGRHREMPVV